MMSSSPKNLSMSVVKKQVAQKFKEKKRINLDKNTKIDVDVVFRPTKKNLVVSTMLDIVSKAYKDSKPFDAGIGIGISTMLIIKHFTSIETDAEDYDGLLEMLVMLKDGGYTDKILNAFDPTELSTMFDELTAAFKMVSDEINTEVEQTKESK